MNITETKSVWDKRTEATAIEEIQSLIGSLGHFPTSGEVRKFGRSGLSNFIEKTGGYIYYRKLMGHPPLVKKTSGQKKRFWKKLKT